MENARSTEFMTQLGSVFRGNPSDWSAWLAAPKLRNVFVARYSSWWSKKLTQTFLEGSWETGGGQKTAWDVIQDIVNYSPGYIAAVRSYDMEATLFVGRPEQPYFWTDGLREQERDFHRETRAIKRQIKQISKGIIPLFLASEFYDGGFSNTDELLELNKLAKVDTQVRSFRNHIFELAKTYPAWTMKIERELRGQVTNSKFASVSGLGPPDMSTPLLLDDKTLIEKVKQFSTLERTSIGSTLNEILDIVGSPGQSVVVDLLLGTPGILQAGFLSREALQKTQSPFYLLGKIWNGTEVTRKRIDQILKEQETHWITVGITPKMQEALAEKLLFHRSSIPVAFRAILDYLKSDPLASFAIRQRSTTLKWPLNPRLKPFRSYHLLSSFEDIIENQIACTRGAMWNGVAIVKGSGTPLTLWADNGIVRDDRILRYFSEPNADTDMYNIGQTANTVIGDFTLNRYFVGYSRIAQGIRPMYRGQLVCRGRPDIQPWDICQIFDHYNAIFGPIEVEGVTHHFSSDTGFITTITPHCVAIANNHLDSWNIMKQSWTMAGVAIGSVLLVTGLALGGVFILGGGLVLSAAIALGAGAATKSAGDAILEEVTGVGVIGNFLMAGQVGGAQSPVKIIPLQRMGTPWVAALRGWGRDPNRGLFDTPGIAWERLKGAGRDVVGGWEGLMGLKDEALEGFNKVSKRGNR